MSTKVKTPFIFEASNGRMRNIYNNGNSFYINYDGKWWRLSDNQNYFKWSWPPRKGEPEPNLDVMGKLSNLRRKRGGSPKKTSQSSTKKPSPSSTNYNKLYKSDPSPHSLNKVRRFARKWLHKNVPANSTYKQLALMIHPNKGNRLNATNQEKRTVLFKYLSQLR
jgi:hypothetical protein